MDKLQPLITHKFWILLSLAVILPIVGWYMASSSLAATFTARKDEIEGVLKTIPPTSNPNPSWAVQLEEINTVQEKRNKEAERFLWAQQVAEMTWPGNVTPFAAKIGYREEFPTVARELYRNSYPLEIDRLWQIIKPHEARLGTGVVDLNPQAIPQQDWGDLPPTSPEMWDCQEDVWLVRSLLESIAAVNGESNRIEAPILVIKIINLMGGDRSTIDSGSSGGAGGGGMEAEMMMSGGGFGGPGPGSRAGGRGEARRSGAISVEFDVTEEFGSARGAGGGGGAPDAFSADGPMVGGAVGNKEKRYVDDEDSLPYKTRGFYLSLVMDHRSVPELIAELTNSNWPVQVVRVQQAMIHEDDVTGSRMTSSGRGPMAAGGPAGMTSADMGDIESSGGEYSGGGILGGGGGGGATTVASNDAAMTNPYLANVTLAGLLTLYKPVEAEDEAQPSDGSAAPTETPVAESSADLTSDTAAQAAADAEPGAADAEPAATPAEPAATPAEPAATDGNASPAAADAAGDAASTSTAEPGDDPPSEPPATSPAEPATSSS